MIYKFELLNSSMHPVILLLTILLSVSHAGCQFGTRQESTHYNGDTFFGKSS
eukprot:m.1649945 g.1649945  ORF g.1649945 m.1649945 type:complete len:52 (-) comp84673_c0_seq1:22-177(-)